MLAGQCGRSLDLYTRYRLSKTREGFQRTVAQPLVTFSTRSNEKFDDSAEGERAGGTAPGIRIGQRQAELLLLIHRATLARPSHPDVNAIAQQIIACVSNIIIVAAFNGRVSLRNA